MELRDPFDNISPLDHRYWDEEAIDLSENAFTRYKILVEIALVKTLCRHGICSEETLREIEEACRHVNTEKVYEEEKRIHHDIRALVNCIRRRVSDSSKPYVHLSATSYDIIDSANALRFKSAVNKNLIPRLLHLEKILIEIAVRESETLQIGRTHGQHAVPITFGFAIAGYVNRLGNCIEALKALTEKLTGKFSGAVGAYNASSLLFEDPESFEKEVLAELGLEPAEHSTQIVPPEAMTRLCTELVITAGVLANLADDMRHLQRTEIGEVGEEFDDTQVGSSTMPQKRNPVNFENIKSVWKIVVPRIVTLLMDQISEHQRDLTNSASSRTYGELVVYVGIMAKRLAKTMAKLKIEPANLQRNFSLQEDLTVAEPLYIVLASLRYPDAHEKVRSLTLEAQRQNKTLWYVAVRSPELRPYFQHMNKRQRKLLSNPALYTGIAAKKARSVAENWKKKLKIH